MHPKNIAFVLCFLFLFRAFGEKMYTIETVPDPKKNGGGYVSNPDGLITKESVSSLNTVLARIDNAGQAQIAVVILKSIGDKVPKEFATALFNLWGLGDKDKDNGLLVLVVTDQHRIEFETGYGLESVLTDAICKRIQMEQMIPYAKEGKLDQALSYGLDAVEQKLSNPEDALAQDTATEESIEIADEEMPEGPPEWSLGKMISDNFFGFFFFGMLSWFFLSIAYLPKKKGVKTKKGTKNKRSLKKTFYIGLAFVVIMLIPVALIEIMHIYFGATGFPFYVVIAIFYVTWCLFVHFHYLVLNPIRNRSKIEEGSRFEKYAVLAESNKSITWFSWIFPFPFMLIYNFIIKAKMKKLRDEPYVCACGATMIKLDETMDDEHLDKGQIAEEQIKSVDYDVWVCNSCQKQLIFKYENYNSSAKPCEECKAKTLEQTTKEVVEAATYSSSGYGYNYFKCKNCGHEQKEKFTIPVKEHSGGGSGSGSSSSSSWGGGSSGGGGSGSSW